MLFPDDFGQQKKPLGPIWHASCQSKISVEFKEQSLKGINNTEFQLPRWQFVFNEITCATSCNLPWPFGIEVPTLLSTSDLWYMRFLRKFNYLFLWKFFHPPQSPVHKIRTPIFTNDIILSCNLYLGLMNCVSENYLQLSPWSIPKTDDGL
jgi:hypothetical protein